MSHSEVSAVDPQQLILLEMSYVAFADNASGACRARLINTDVGVYLGVSGSTANTVSVYSGTSTSMAVASGRISYTLGLTGPCFPVDTACSASLVALHLAECSSACVCGEGLLEVTAFAAFSAAGMLSAFGRCHTFDRRGDGYCRGEGCGAFLLDSEVSTKVAVLGTAVQQDGPSASLTAPNGSSQR
ncbi:hypothetical protein AURANDRAFT_59676 [Aureococcus anophagefferens]|uniref:Ketosynthase family 3 (KS3) domain-containing protein n=1 Tax=Aureococcus anophagefferens TaxID=44056 RepID=F0YP34_AURAN|nr:hypothetical protein AURANDRAFT_59676 [Aureococcus anophagefferens]EGB03125.1 hypothetical protein AURANDRAFT_59676 [Aureococcus anophagefferens]|eukprot:XP_009042175.1 hypothetical protein AURANDRAFT_59676 [Aureococcus anophagefferens]